MLLFLKIVATIILLLLIAGISIQLLFGDSLKSFVVKTINERAATKIHVAGDIAFSLIEHFPYVSVNLYKVRIEDSFQSKTDLLSAQKISIQLNLWNFITGYNTISKIAVYEGNAHILIDKRGNGNYFIFKNSQNADDSKVNINKIILHKIECVYHDEFVNQHYEALIKGAILSGNFSTSQFDLSSQAELFFHHLFINDIDYATDKDVILKGGLQVNTKTGLYQIQSTRIWVNASEFKVSGKVQEMKDHLQLDLFVSGAEAGISDIGAILPNDYSAYLKDIQTKGKLSFTGTIKGKLSKIENPEVFFIFDIKDATVAHRESKQRLEKVNMQVKFSNGAKRSWNNSSVSIQQASAVYENAPIRFDLLLSQFKNPYLSVKINGTFRIGILTTLLGRIDAAELDGIVQVENFSYRGYLRDVKSNTALTQSEGFIILKDLRYKNENVLLDNCRAKIELKNDLISINFLNGNFQSSTFNITGELSHFIPVLIRVWNDKHYRVSRAFYVNLSIESGPLNTNSLFTNVHSNGTDSMDYVNRLIRCAAGVMDIKIESLTHQKIFLTQIGSKINFNQERFYFNQLRFNAWKGTITANGSIDLSKEDAVTLESALQANNIDIRDVFKAFDNFDQQTLTYNNLQGILNTSLTLKAYWQNGIFQSDKLQVLADVTVLKGELIRFKPLYALSKFVKIEELDDIRFSRLSNQISIKNKTVFIPSTIINTNALNLELTGTHTFDNIIDYNVKLNLLQLLSNKFKRNNTFDPDAAEKDPSGLLNLYLTLKGPADDPIIQYDKKSVKTVIKESMKQEQQSLKDALKKEFSKQQQVQQQEQIKDWEAPQEYELIEFDDDDTSK